MESLTNQPTSRTISKSAIFDGPGWGKTQIFPVFPNCPTVLQPDCNRIAACWEEGRQGSPVPGPLGREGELCALPCCVHRLSSAASRVFTPGNPCAGPMDSSAEEASRAASASTHARAHWSQVGQGKTFETVFVASDTQILEKVPVGEKVYLQRDPVHGGLSAITQGGSSRQNVMKEIPGATLPVCYCLGYIFVFRWHTHAQSFLIVRRYHFARW